MPTIDNQKSTVVRCDLEAILYHRTALRLLQARELCERLRGANDNSHTLKTHGLIR
jgi:hypothetical protein